VAQKKQKERYGLQDGATEIGAGTLGIGMLSKGGKVGFLTSNSYKNRKNLGTLGRKAGVLLGAGALTGAMPIASGYLANKYKGDQEFNGSHFAQILAPSVIDGATTQMLWDHGAKAMTHAEQEPMKNSFKRLISRDELKNSFKEYGKSFKDAGKIGKIGFMGMTALSLMDPLSYYMRTHSNKKALQKTASDEKLLKALVTLAAGYGIYNTFKRKKENVKDGLKALTFQPVEPIGLTIPVNNGEYL